MDEASSMKSVGWGPIPTKTKPNKGKSAYVDFAVSTKVKLNKCSKKELVNEVVRLQTLMKSIAMELGICRRSATGGTYFRLHFVSDIIALLKLAWRRNL